MSDEDIEDIENTPTPEAARVIKEARVRLGDLRQSCLERSKHYRELAAFYEHEVEQIDAFIGPRTMLDEPEPSASTREMLQAELRKQDRSFRR